MAVEFLKVAVGRLSYEDTHTGGPLVILGAPLGTTRSVYRFVSPMLSDAGFRVVSLDLRGHGASSTDWDDYSIAAHGEDLVAVIQALEAGPAFVVGNSFSGGSAVWAAAEGPENEASFQAEILGAKKVMVDGGGDHPQADSPDVVAAALLDFFAEVRRAG
jgi:pimeloyl-ACP methyl ester carboxylesterase